MLSVKRAALGLAIGFFLVGAVHAQSPVNVIDAELAVPFGATKGHLAIAGNQIVFVATDNSKASIAFTRSDIRDLSRSDEIITITTRRPYRDADGERDTFRFRVSQSTELLGWFNAPSTPSMGETASSMAPSDATVLASFQVTHDHLLGGCLGTLILTPSGVTFESNNEISHSRQWKLLDVKEVGQDGPYKLKVAPFVGDTFNFALAGKGMDAGEYRRLVDRIARARGGE